VYEGDSDYAEEAGYRAQQAYANAVEANLNSSLSLQQERESALMASQLSAHTVKQFKANLLSVLGKFAKAHTHKKAAEELRLLMTADITDNERMSLFLAALGDLNEHMTLAQMKEQIIQFGVAAEIFEDALIPFLPKILGNFTKKLKDEAHHKIYAVIAEAVGQLEWHILSHLEGDEQLSAFEKHFELFAHQVLDKTRSKTIQQGALSCLTKIIVNCPDEVLFDKLPDITTRMEQMVRSKHFQAHQQYLECLISVIFHIQTEFRHFYQKFLPYLLEQIGTSKDAAAKRVAIDAVYSIGAHLKEEVCKHAGEILAVLSQCKTDKSQPVRAAAQETIKLIKDLQSAKKSGNVSYGESLEDSGYFQNDIIDVELSQEGAARTVATAEPTKPEPADIQSV
jgi:hypothetical protein